MFPHTILPIKNRFTNASDYTQSMVTARAPLRQSLRYVKPISIEMGMAIAAELNTSITLPRVTIDAIVHY